MSQNKSTLIDEHQAQVPDPEGTSRSRHGTYSAEDKLRILEEADACTEPGQIGTLLRREGLHSSQLARWRQLRLEGQLQALSPQKRGPKSSDAQENQLRLENERLKVQLGQAKAIIEIQKELLAALYNSQGSLDLSLCVRAAEELIGKVGV